MALSTHFLQSVAGPSSNGMLILFLSFSALAFPAAGPAQFPDSPAALKLLRLLSSTLSGLARLFSHLLRRTPPEATQRRPDFSLLLPALQTPGFLRGQKEHPGRLSLLLGAALTLPGRPPGERLPREEDAGAGQRSSMLVSTVVSTTPHLWPHIYRLRPQLFPNPLFAGPAGAPAARRGGKVETGLSTF